MAKKNAKRKQPAEQSGKGEDDIAYSSIATHPRARVAVRKTKAWFGLAAFAIAALLSLKAAVPLFQTAERALIAGIAGYLLAWWFSLIVWRHWMLAEQRAAVAEIERRRAEAMAGQEAREQV